MPDMLSSSNIKLISSYHLLTLLGLMEECRHQYSLTPGEIRSVQLKF